MGANGPISGKTGQDVFISPIASPGTKEMQCDNNQGKVSGVEDHAGTPDPLGYFHGQKPKH